MGKKLLIPTNFSTSSWNTIQYAILLHENVECDFYILNTYAKEVYGLDSISLLDPDEVFHKRSEKRSRQGLEDMIVQLTFGNDNPKHRFHMISRSTVFIDAIKDIVSNMQIDMIIMDAIGTDNEKELSYGNSTFAVIEAIRICPVLVVPKNISFNLPREIILATNFNTDFKASEVQYLAKIAKMLGASIQVLSLTDNCDLSLKQRENKVRLRKYFKDVAYSFHVIQNAKMPNALSCFVEKCESHMISFIDKKPSFLEQVGFGTPSLAKLGYFNNIAILALHG